MAVDYPGNADTAQSPSPQPEPGEIPVYSIPADGDDLNAASVAQDFKTSADYSAYLMTPGHMRVYQENYNCTVGTVTGSGVISTIPSLTTTINGSGSQIDETISGIGQYFAGNRGLLFTAGATNGYYAVLSTTKTAYDASKDNVQLCFEQASYITTTGNGNYYIGLTDNPAAGTVNFWGIRHLHTDTDWILQVPGGTTTVTSSAPSNGVAQLLKIIYSGANTPVGVANGTVQVIRVYLNDALLLTHTGSLISTSGNKYAFTGAYSTGAAGAICVYGGWSLSWNNR